MQEMPTAVVVGAKFVPHAVAIQRWLSSLSFRVYTTQDTVGVELGGALKNPLAVGAVSPGLMPSCHPAVPPLRPPAPAGILPSHHSINSPRAPTPRHPTAGYDRGAWAGD